MHLQIFCDFDGTVVAEDVGQQLFLAYASRPACEAAVAEWKRGAISSAEMYRRECAAAQLEKSELQRFAKRFHLDPHFKPFAAACHRRAREVFILSDGFTPYITAILERGGLGGLPVFANELIFVQGGKIEPRFPYSAGSCSACANCKGYHVRRLLKPGGRSVFVGNGYSDRCGALAADLILAKDDLASYCRENSLHYIPFENFSDVARIIDSL